MYWFNLLNEHNLSLLHSRPKNYHALNYSILKDAQLSSTFQGFSIVYVCEGVEHHTLNGRSYDVAPGQYLLSNPYCSGHVYLKSRQAVHGLCIDVLPGMFQEVLSSLLMPMEPEATISLHDMLHSGDFLEHYATTETRGLGAFLHHFTNQFRHHPEVLPALDESFFYHLTELYVADYKEIVKRIQSVHAVKTYVRKDILRLLARSKALMDDRWSEPLSVQDIARAGNMSKYHFSRLFQSAYGVPPHRYLWQKRLEYGRAMLRIGGRSALDIALQCGFADLASFSKAYKQYYGEPPSKILKISTI